MLLTPSLSTALLFPTHLDENCPTPRTTPIFSSIVIFETTVDARAEASAHDPKRDVVSVIERLKSGAKEKGTPKVGGKWRD